MANEETDLYSIEGRGLKLNSADDVADFVAAMKDIKLLREVRLGGNTFGVEAAKAIASALKEKHDLQILKFSDMFTGRLKDEIPRALEAIVAAVVDKNLVEVDLSDNAFGPAGALPLMRLLTENRNIRVLKLNNNGLGVEGGRLISEALVSAARKNEEDGKESVLTEVVMGRNRLENGGAEFLAKAFAVHRNLRILRMPQNSIRPSGITALVKGLSECVGLTELDLQDNTICPEGSVSLAAAIEKWSELAVLNVADCLVKEEGGVLLLNALKRCEQLRKLDVGWNEMKRSSARALVEMAAGKNLHKVEVNGNIFGDDEVDEIREALGEALGDVDEMEEEDEEEEDIDELADSLSKVKVEN